MFPSLKYIVHDSKRKNLFQDIIKDFMIQVNNTESKNADKNCSRILGVGIDRFEWI
jgi:hypothetical protein